MTKKRPKRISQAKIAQELGCSQALVSMALNGRKKGISQSVYKMIWDYAVKQGYSPRGMSIDTARESAITTTIGYILRSPLKLANKSNFFSHVHQGLHDHLDQKRIKTVFLGSEDDIDLETLSISDLIPDSVKGIAIMGEVDAKLLDTLKSTGKPIVYISARATGICHSVLSNEPESAETLVDHFSSLGHTQFAWLGGMRGMRRNTERFGGLVSALSRRQLTLDERFVTQFVNASRKEGHQAAKQIIENSEDGIPTAWICLNGLMARGAANFLIQNGYKVGKEISIGAFDMTNICTDEDPQITSSGADPEDIGSEAARIILGAMDNSLRAYTDITLPSKLIIRETSGKRSDLKVSKKA